MKKPIIKQCSSKDFKNIEDIIEQGIVATKRKLPEIQFALEQWKEK